MRVYCSQNSQMSVISYRSCVNMVLALGGSVVMQRFGTVIKLKAECETRYRQYHAAVCPEVLQKIRECNIENYSIFLKNDLLLAYFEYRGDDIKSDLEKLASHPKTQEWWPINATSAQALAD